MALSFTNKSDINPLKRLYNEASSGAYPWFNEKDWEFALKDSDEGGVENYLSAVLASRKLPFNEDKVKYLDSSTRISYLYSNLLYNNTDDDSKKSEYLDMIKGIEERNDQLKEQYYLDVKDQERANMNWFKALGPNILGFLGRLGQGIGETAWNLQTIAQASTLWISDKAGGTSIDPNNVDINSLKNPLHDSTPGAAFSLDDRIYNDLTDEDKMGLYGFVKNKDGQWVEVPDSEKFLLRMSILKKPSDEVDKILTKWEMDHTAYRNYDGSYNYKSFQGAVGSALSETGRVMGNMITVVPAGAISPHLSAALLYTSFGVSEDVQTYRSFKERGVSINATEIMWNTTIKMIAQRSIEMGLDFIVGPGVTGRLLGRTGEGIVRNNVSNLVAKRFLDIVKDATREAIEENLQDLSDFLINRATSAIVEESAYNDLVDISINGMMNTAAVAALSSLLFSSVRNLTQKNLLPGSNLNIIEKMKSVQLVTDLSDVSKSLQIFDAAIEEKYMDLFGLEQVEMTPENISKALAEMSETERQSIFKDMQSIESDINKVTSLTTMAKQVLDDMGEDGLKSAVNNLNVLKQKASEGYFDVSDMKLASEAATYIVDNIDTQLKVNEISRKLEDHGIKKLLKKFVKKSNGAIIADNIHLNVEHDDPRNLEITPEQQKKDEAIVSAIMKKTGATNVVVSEDGSAVMIDKKTLSIPLQFFADASELYKQLAEDYFYENLKNDERFAPLLKLIKEYECKYFGRSEISDRESIYYLMDGNVFHALLTSSDAKVYRLLEYLLVLEKKAESEPLLEDIIKKLHSIRDMWINEFVNYASLNVGVDYSLFLKFVPDELRSKAEKLLTGLRIKNQVLGYYRTHVFDINDEYAIKNNYIHYLERYCKYYYNMSLQKYLERRGESQSQDSDYRIIRLLENNNPFRKVRYIDILDGRYLEDTSIANRMFNNYLDSIGKDLKTILDIDSLNDSERQEIMNLYGDVNLRSLLKYRNEILKESTHGSYTLQVDRLEDGHDGDYELAIRYNDDVVTFDRFENFKRQKNMFLTGVTKSTEGLDDYIIDTLDDAVKDNLSIDDVINSPDIFLSDATKDEIMKKFGRLDSLSTLMYLRKEIETKTDYNKSILYSKDGYVIGNFELAKNIVRDNVDMTTLPSMKEIIKPEYYIKNVNVSYTVLTEAGGYYHPDTGLIEIDYNNAKNNPQYALLTALHEYMHELQYQYGLVSGFNARWYYRKLSEAAKKGIQMDFMKHVGKFSENMLYQCTGESLAFGYGSTNEITFIPLVPSKKYSLITPWGHGYTNDGKIVDLKRTYHNELTYIAPDLSDGIKEYLMVNNIGSSAKLDTNIKGPILDKIKKRLTRDLDSLKPIEYVTNFDSSEYADIKNEYFQKLYDEITGISGVKISFEDFMNTQFPVITIASDQSADTYVRSYFYNFSEINASLGDAMYIHYLKPSDIVAPALDSNDFTVLVKLDTLKDSYLYDRSLYFTNRGLIDFDTGEVFTPTNTSLDPNIIVTSAPGDIVDENVMASPSAQGDSYETYNKRYKDAIKHKVRIEGAAIDGNPTKKGGIPKFDKDGNQQFDKNGKPIYVYPQKNRSGRRSEITKKEAAQNDNYKGFVTKAQRAKMTPEMKEFVKNAKDLPPSLQKKIDNGTLKERDVMDYFRENENIPESIFNQINDAFFGNDVIKNSSELNKLTTESPSLYAYAMVIYERIKHYNEKGETKLASQWEQLLKTDDVEMIDFIKNKINDDEDLRKRYDFYFDRYEKTTKGRYDQSFIINEQTLKTLFMKSYDGSLESAGKLISAARYLAKRGSKQSGTRDTTTTGQFVDGQEDRLTRNIGEDVDSVDLDLLQGELSYDELQQEYVRDLYQQKFEELIDQGVQESDAQKQASMEAIKEVMNMDRSELEKKHFEKMAKDATGENYTVESVSDKTIVTPQILKNRIDGKLNNLKRKLTGNQWKRFVKEHNDLFTEDGKIKRELYITKQQREGGSSLVDKLDGDKLEEVSKKLNDAIESFKYTRRKLSKDDLRVLEKLSKTLRENAKKVGTTSEKITKKQRTVVETNFVVDNKVVTIETTKPIPEKLKTLLQTVYTQQKKTMVQEVTEENQTHAVQSMNQFFEQHNRTLQSLSKYEAINIINFYTENVIESIDQNYREQYHATQLYTLTYIFKQNKLGFFQFTKEELASLKKQIGPIVSADARGLAIWGNCLKYLNPEKATMKAVAKGMELQFNEQEMEAISKALQDGDFEMAMKIKEQMYENTIKKYGKGKQSFLQKLWNFERACMLSSPSTWVRNYASNWLVKLSNKVADKIGSWVGSKILDKIFKDSAKFDGYKLTNTKVSDKVSFFIQNNQFDKLYDLVSDGMTKYDVKRQIEKYHKNTEDMVKDMIVNSITAQYNLSNQTDIEIVNKCIQSIYKKISDDKFVKARTLELFGKILTEDNIPLDVHHKGVDAMDTVVTDRKGYKYADPRVMDAFVKAFNLASYEYMHTSNFMNDIENTIRNRFGDTGFVLYKQIFPFLAPSINWAVEGLRLTPMNLVKSIVDYAKLEKKAQTMEERAQKVKEHGFQPGGYDRAFVKYMVQRNIGKGILGTIGFGIGAILAGFGVIKFNDDDDKYEIQMGDISVDVSSLYGTSGLLIGGTLVGGIRRMAKDDNETFWKVLSDVMNVVADDTLVQDFYNTFRFGDDLLSIIANKGAQIPLMLIPNIVKAMVPIFQTWGITYSNGTRGKIEKYFAKVWPYFHTRGVDIYTGDTVARYGGSTNVSHWSSFFAQATNKFLPIKITPNVYTKLQREAIAVGVNKTELTGRYDEKSLNASQKRKLNQYYGKLNNSTLTELMANKVKYTVTDSNGKEVSLTYGKMSDKQKKDVITRIMSNNARTAKIWYFTENEGYKYYTSESEYTKLKKLGVKNVYKKDKKHDGLVK